MDNMWEAFANIHNLIIIIILNTFFALQLATVGAVLHIFSTISSNFKENDDQNNFEADGTVKRRKTNESNESEKKNEIFLKGLVPLIEITENDHKRDSWETLRFFNDDEVV